MENREIAAMCVCGMRPLRHIGAKDLLVNKKKSEDADLWTKSTVTPLILEGF